MTLVKGEDLSNIPAVERIAIIAREIVIPAHGNCNASTPTDVSGEKMGDSVRAVTTCGNCKTTFVTFPHRNTWYQVKE